MMLADSLMVDLIREYICEKKIKCVKPLGPTVFEITLENDLKFTVNIIIEGEQIGLPDRVFFESMEARLKVADEGGEE